MVGEPAASPPVSARPRVRWGLPDVGLAWVVGLIAALIVSSIVAAAAGVDTSRVSDDVGVLLASVVGQAIGVIGTLELVARRKGRGSLGADFGLVARLPGGRWTTAALWLLAGVALQLAILPFLQIVVDVHGKAETQDVVEQFKQARGPALVLFAVIVVTVAPVAEELLFRGALLRALQRRMTPACAAAEPVDRVGDRDPGPLRARSPVRRARHPHRQPVGVDPAARRVQPPHSRVRGRRALTRLRDPIPVG